MILNFLKRLFCRHTCRVDLFGRTDTGLTRPNNEDSFAILPESNLMLVADGMGGHNAGEVASRIAIEAMVNTLSPDTLMQSAGNPDTLRHLLLHAMRRVNDQVIAKTQEDNSYSGMGCTFILGLVSRGLFHTCHVGDVRAYLLTKEFRRLTDDHTHAARLAKEGKSNQNSQGGPIVTRHVVTRAMGYPFPDDPDCTTTAVCKGDRILLCSDGLWSMLPDTRLEEILRRAATPEEACDAYISAANEAGGKDNITAVVGFV